MGDSMGIGVEGELIVTDRYCMILTKRKKN